MAEYEMVREIPNLCPNNQMRDVFIEEISTDDPVTWVENLLKGNKTVTADYRPDGSVTVYAVADGLTQKFIFTPI